MNQRGGGNFAKAAAEIAGLTNTTGSDARGFCAAPTHALIEAASLVKAGTYKTVIVTGGGCTAKLGMNTYNGSKTEQFVIRIPADQLDSFESIISDSCTVTDKSENVEDITDTYNETESELESLRQEMDSLNAMLTKAETVTDTIAIQDRISDVRSRIGTLEAQMKTYDAQISYSRVSVYLSEDSIAKTDSQTVGERISHGFRSTIKLLGDFFVALFVFVISASPILAILAAIIVLILCLSRRSARKKKKPYQDRPGVPDYIDTWARHVSIRFFSRHSSNWLRLFLNRTQLI